MPLARKIIAARRLKGLTQEELADKSGVTSRTIQRIESGETLPRSFTLKAIASSLGIPFEDLINDEAVPDTQTPTKTALEDTGPADLIPGQGDRQPPERHALQSACLSCFTFLVIPYVHFLIPRSVLSKQKLSLEAVRFGRKLIRSQVIWVIALNFSLLFAFFINLVSFRHGLDLRISYLSVLGIFCAANTGIVIYHYRLAGRVGVD